MTAEVVNLFPEGHIFYGLKRNHYRFILLDPATKFVGGTKGRPQHYERMEDWQIASLPLRELAHPDGAWVGCWISSPKMRWLFRYNEGFLDRKLGREVPGWRAKFSGRMHVWLKTKRSHSRLSSKPLFLIEKELHIGGGFTTRKNCEDIWLFKFGTPKRHSMKVREPIFAPVREHSRKPDEARDRVVEFAPGPYCELFARQTDSRFDVWGNEIGRFFPAISRGAAAA